MNPQPDNSLSAENPHGTILSSVLGAIRTSAKTVAPATLVQLRGLLPVDTQRFLDRIVEGNATRADGNAENVMELLSVFQIPVETAVPIWPPPQVHGLGDALASCQMNGACDATELDEFFLRIRVIKEIFSNQAAVS